MKLKIRSNAVKRGRGDGDGKTNKKLETPLFLIILLSLFAVVIAVACGAVTNAKRYAGFKACCGEVINCCERFDLQPELVFAIIRAESGFNRLAKSDKGACGLMQLMPKTANFAAELSGYSEKIDLFNPNCNIYLGCVYLNYLFKRFENEKNVICAYNAGEGRVSLWLSEQYAEPRREKSLNESDNKTGASCEILQLKEIPFSETRAYYARVCDYKVKYGRLLKRLAAKK